MPYTDEILMDKLERITKALEVIARKLDVDTNGTEKKIVHTAASSKINSGFVNRREAAEYLGVSEQTLAIWKSTGRYSLPYTKIGRLVKYKKEDLEIFIKRFQNQ